MEADQHSWTAGTGDGGQVAGGSAFHTLPLVVLEMVVRGLLAVRDPLKNEGATKALEDMLGHVLLQHQRKRGAVNPTRFFTVSLRFSSSRIMATMSLWTAEARTTSRVSAFIAMLQTISSWENTLYRCSMR